MDAVGRAAQALGEARAALAKACRRIEGGPAERKAARGGEFPGRRG